jgi:phage terminase large subunit-like protein
MTLASPLYSSPIRTADGRILPSTGESVCGWIEENLRYGEGDWYGEKVVLRPFQRRFLYRAYEFYPETGRRRYKRCVLGAGKGSGKTPIGAFVGAYELAGGINVAPRVLMGASSLKQGNLVFGDLRDALKGTDEHPAPLRPFILDYDLQILLKGRRGTAERIAAAVGTNDGARATFFAADELHEWRGRASRVFIVVDGAIAKRERGWTLVISTAGIDDEEDDNPLKALYDYGRRLARSEIVDDRFLFEWYEAPAGLNLDDPTDWLSAIHAANPAAGDFTSIENLRFRFETLPRHEFERYHLNRWPKGEDVWEVAELWASLADDTVDLEPDLPTHVMIDVGLRHDSSAVVAAQELPGGAVVVRSRVWENPYPASDPRHEHWTLNIAEIENFLRAIHGAYPAPARELAGPAFYYDKTFFERSADDLMGEGLNMMEYPQSDARMVPASQRFFQLVKEGLIVHDGDPVLARHIANVVPHEREKGWRISKPRGSKRHIDAAVAAAVAAHEATRTEPDEPTPTPSLYI